MSRFVCSHDLSRIVIFAKWRLCSLVINGNNPFQIFKDVKKVIDPLKEVYLILSEWSLKKSTMKNIKRFFCNLNAFWSAWKFGIGDDLEHHLDQINESSNQIPCHTFKVHFPFCPFWLHFSNWWWKLLGHVIVDHFHSLTHHYR